MYGCENVWLKAIAWVEDYIAKIFKSIIVDLLLPFLLRLLARSLPQLHCFLTVLDLTLALTYTRVC